MKKQITIIQENSSPLVIDDSDEKELKQYTDDLAKLLENNNITLLHTTSCSVIIRPHIINSIIVRELDRPPSDQTETNQTEEITEDIVTDSEDGIVSD